MNVEQVDNAVRIAGASGLAVAGYGGISQETFIAYVGLAVVVLTFLTNFIFRIFDNIRKRKAGAREQELHDIEMQLKRKQLEE